MNSKKVNRLFLITIILDLALGFLIPVFFPKLGTNLFAGNFLVEMAVLLPALLCVFLSGEKPVSFLNFHRIKLTSVLMIILFTFLLMPFITLINLVSQLFVPNEVSGMITDYHIMDLSFWPVFLLIGAFAPFCEEVVCRGVYYQGYKKTGGVFSAMLFSSLLFALVHMNLNQAAYAFAVGIAAVLLVEATGSLWSSVLLHTVINASQVCLMFVTFGTYEATFGGEVVPEVTNDVLLTGITSYLIIAAVTLPLAWAVLVWLNGNENRRGALADIWNNRNERPRSTLSSQNKKDKMITIPLVTALILCIALIAFDLILNRLV